jgi:DNA sulfur modification protein DndD
MKFKKIAITNIGSFMGKWEFDLEINKGENKPIILFGGLNGSGKTTVFEAIKLCLYGKDIFNSISKTKYSEYLIEKIHKSKSKAEQPDSAAIEIEFEYSKFGEKNIYKVKRFWEVKDNKINEELIIKRDNAEIDNIQSYNWQEFIIELIPPGLTELFFFDGEKIQRIMDNNNKEFKNSVNSLLGLNIIDQLSSDLIMYKTKRIKEVSSIKYRSELKALENKIDELDNEVNIERSTIAELENHIAKGQDKLRNYENKIKAQGIQFLQIRDQLVSDKISKEKEHEYLQEEIRAVIGGLFPIVLARKLSLRLKEELKVEENNRIEKFALDKFLEHQKELLRRFSEQLNKSKFDLLKSYEVNSHIKNVLVKEMDSVYNSKSRDVITPKFNLSSNQVDKIINSINEAVDIIPQKVMDLFMKLEQVSNEVREVYSKINQIPDDEYIKPMILVYNNYQKEVDDSMRKKDNIEEKIKLLEKNLIEVRRTHDNIIDKIEKIDKDQLKINHIEQTGKILTEYKRALTKKRLEVLKLEFVKIFNKLHRKKDLIDSISIDYDTFDLKLFDKNNNLINKDNLSSGEKEIYAFSLLYALSKTSGQNLPFIIDTPLGRLDSTHRENIINNFFPTASEQMVIFSTNTEIDRDYFNLLKKYVSKNYNLIFNNNKRYTEVEEGYFWN